MTRGQVGSTLGRLAIAQTATVTRAKTAPISRLDSFFIRTHREPTVILGAVQQSGRVMVSVIGDNAQSTRAAAP
jgi:hypothetical protein